MSDDLHKLLEAKLDAMLADLQRRDGATPKAPSIDDIISLAELVAIVEDIHYEQLMTGQLSMPVIHDSSGLLH